MATEKERKRVTREDGSAAEPGFEEIIGKLEAIAKRLEAGETRLEEALSLYEEGVRLSRLGGERLDAAEKKLEVLRDQGRVEPLVADERRTEE